MTPDAGSASAAPRFSIVRLAGWGLASLGILGWLALSGAPPAAAYQLYRGPGFVWHPAFRPIAYWVSDMPDNWMGVEAVIAETRAAFDAWEAPAETGISFSYRGRTKQLPFDLFDQTNTVGFSTREHLAELGLSPTTLGVTSWLTVAGTGEIVEADILINPAYNWTDSPARTGGWDFRSTMIHEVGHFLGLGHSNVGRWEEGQVLAGSAVMWPYSFGRGRSEGRTLTADDIVGASVLYPGSAAGRGRIRGTVVRAGVEEGVRHAHITAYEPLLDLLVGAWADENGNYEIGGLPDGRYVLRVNPIPMEHSPAAYFFSPGQADQDFPVTVLPRLIIVSGGVTPDVRIEVGS